MKTKIKNWLEALPFSEERAKAFNNSNEERLNTEVENLTDALIGAFEWKDSPEGASYWMDVFKKIIDVDAKTVPEWLKTLEEPYRTQALANLKESPIEVVKLSASDALGYAFSWGSSPEGDDHWRDYHKKLSRREAV